MRVFRCRCADKLLGYDDASPDCTRCTKRRLPTTVLVRHRGINYPFFITRYPASLKLHGYGLVVATELSTEGLLPGARVRAERAALKHCCDVLRARLDAGDGLLASAIALNR